MKFTVHSVLKMRGEDMIEVVYFNSGNNQFEYPKFEPELLTKVSDNK